MLVGGSLAGGVRAEELKVGCGVLAKVSPGCHLVGAGYDAGAKAILHFHHCHGDLKGAPWPSGWSCQLYTM